MQILPCPFCGYDGAQVDETSPRVFNVICTECDCIGPASHFVANAIASWNDRKPTYKTILDPQ